jgi:hypothetical protein
MSFSFRFKTVTQAEDDANGDYAGAIRDAFPELDVIWGDGTSDNQADRFYYDERSLAGAAAETLDLTALTPGPGGSTITLAEVRFFAIHCPSTNTDDMQIKGAAATNWSAFFSGSTDHIKLAAGTTTYFIVNAIDGSYAVAAGSKSFTITNAAAATAGTYKILLVGPSV